MIDFKYSNVYSRANAAAYKAPDGNIYISVAIHPFDARDSVIRCSARYLPGEGRKAAMDFQAIVTGEFDLRERFGPASIPAGAKMLALCGVNPILRREDLHPALEEGAVLLDRDFTEAFDFEGEQPMGIPVCPRL